MCKIDCNGECAGNCPANKPIQEQPEVMQAIKFDMLADWLRKADVKPEIVERLVVGYCRRNRKAHPTPPFQEDED